MLGEVSGRGQTALRLPQRTVYECRWQGKSPPLHSAVPMYDIKGDGRRRLMNRLMWGSARLAKSAAAAGGPQVELGGAGGGGGGGMIG